MSEGEERAARALERADRRGWGLSKGPRGADRARLWAARLAGPAGFGAALALGSAELGRALAWGGAGLWAAGASAAGIALGSMAAGVWAGQAGRALALGAGWRGAWRQGARALGLAARLFRALCAGAPAAALVGVLEAASKGARAMGEGRVWRGVERARRWGVASVDGGGLSGPRARAERIEKEWARARWEWMEEQGRLGGWIKACECVGRERWEEAARAWEGAPFDPGWEIRRGWGGRGRGRGVVTIIEICGWRWWPQTPRPAPDGRLIAAALERERLLRETGGAKAGVERDGRGVKPGPVRSERRL